MPWVQEGKAGRGKIIIKSNIVGEREGKWSYRFSWQRKSGAAPLFRGATMGGYSTAPLWAPTSSLLLQLLKATTPSVTSFDFNFFGQLATFAWTFLVLPIGQDVSGYP